MDITPVYELRNRLRGAAIEGTRLISEDFRLKKAAEAFSALSGASPVFGKLNELVQKLLSDSPKSAEELPQILAEALTLADAVIVTLGTSNAKGDFEPLIGNGTAAVTINAPYSQIAPLINALTVSGSGGYSVFMDTVNNSPEIFNDYRVKSVLVKGLGASYSGLAAEVAKFLPKLGKEMIPLLKNGFDNKGKKEMAYRIEVMGDIAGEEENDYYLKQLETAENDAKKALIAALRFDKSNFRRLTELVKTEKGEAKKIALKAIMYMDDENAAEFFRGYSEKKPVEVLELLANVSTEMTSGLAAEIINKCLIDKDGNKIPLSMTVTPQAIKSGINIKASWTNLYGALCGKFGKKIEAFYRDFYTDEENFANAMDHSLGNAVIISGDEGLKALALELNGKSKMKGRYIYSEAVVRLLENDNRDCAKWFDKALKSLPRNAKNNAGVLGAIGSLAVYNENYFLNVNHTDAMGKWAMRQRPIENSVAEAIIELMIKHYDEQPDFLGVRICVLLDPGNAKLCKAASEFFLKNVCGPYNPKNAYGWRTPLSILDKCGCRNVKGLTARFCKNNLYIENYRLANYIGNLPGDAAYKQEEAREVVKLVREGKLKFEKFNINTFEQWLERELVK